MHIKNKVRNLYHRIKLKLCGFANLGSSTIYFGGPIYCRNSNVRIGNNVHLYPNIAFLGEGDINIADGAKIGNNVIIHASKGSSVEIGSNTIIAANSYIIDCNHNIAKESLISSQGVIAEPIVIGEDVWIGASCIIAKGAALGQGCVIGANSFVNMSVPSYSVVAGTPAKIIKYRE